MKTLVAFFAATKYWSDPTELRNVMDIVEQKFSSFEMIETIDGQVNLEKNYEQFDTVIIVPLSGSVQPEIIKLSENFKKIILFGCYITDNYELEVTDNILYKNAAPTLIDSYAVLKRDKDKMVILAKNFNDIYSFLKVLDAYDHVTNGKITVVGGPEPWVISVSRKFEQYQQQLGVQMELIPQEELIDLYEATTLEECRDIYDYFVKDATEIVEPNETDLENCSRMARAMVKLLEKHQTDGLAIACFDLIGRTGVNPCLGVSYINTETAWFASCEGDVDSAVTMLMMQKLTDEKLWMANPCLEKDNSVNFSHCTAPTKLHGKKVPFLLRNHHESGLGTSPRVFYDQGMVMSLLRYSGVENALTMNSGVSIEGRYEPTCRTQVRVQLDDYGHYIDTVLGCHQVMTFENITKEMEELCKLLQVEVR